MACGGAGGLQPNWHGDASTIKFVTTVQYLGLHNKFLNHFVSFFFYCCPDVGGKEADLKCRSESIQVQLDTWSSCVSLLCLYQVAVFSMTKVWIQRHKTDDFAHAREIRL